jgi:tetratricopeptide (TPR) repeat protein
LICISPFAGYSINNEQVNPKFTLGDSLFRQGEYRLAGLVFEDIAFNAQTADERCLALIRRGECYLIQKNFPAAERSFSRITYYDLSDELHYQARYKSALASYLNSNFEIAISHLVQLYEVVNNDSLKKSSLLLKALCHNELNQWNEAQNELMNFSNFFYSADSGKLSAVQQEINNLYKTDNHPRYRNIEKARKLSLFIPGAGQIYSGYYKEAFISMALNGFGLALIGLGIWQRYYVSGALIGFPLWQRFLSGGVNRSGVLAEQRNKILKREYNNRLETLIHSLESGQR